MRKTAEDRLAELEAVLEQMLKPVKGIPFRIIVKSIAGCEVIPIDPQCPEDADMLRGLERAIHAAAAEVRLRPIERPRPNEVGNDIEVFVKAALLAQGFRVESPAARNGLTKGVGYPDILIFDKAGRPTYVECKTYSAGTVSSSMRSFYLSPSENFKVSLDARHVVLSFEMIADALPGSRNSRYAPVGFKLIDVSDLLCDVKYEFNSDNRRLYDKDLILLEGKF
jgi:hypothetical protein